MQFTRFQYSLNQTDILPNSKTMLVLNGSILTNENALRVIGTD